jgi:hypothetical protein
VITFLRQGRERAPSDPVEEPAEPTAGVEPGPRGGLAGRGSSAAEGVRHGPPFAGARYGSPGTTYGRLGAWAALIAIAFAVGAVLRAAGALPIDALPPLHAHARLLAAPLIPAAVLALAGVTALPIAARRLPWPGLLAISWPASAAWAVALQLPDGLSRPLTNRADYLAGLPAMGEDPLGWLRGFTTHLSEYPVHVEGHPPLPMLILWILRWTGLEGAGWATALVIAAGASSTAAIAVTVRAVASEPLARRALPFLILAPTAIWVATSMDALFLAISAWGVALLARATKPRGGGGPRPPWGAIPLLSSWLVDTRDKRFHRLWITLPSRGSERSTKTLAGAFAGGMLIGSLPYLSYGLVSILALPLAVLILTRPRRSLMLAFGLGCLVVPVAFAFAGFVWWDGVIQTHAAWAAGAGAQRPYAYFLIGDLAVLALLIGPAAAQAVPYLLRPSRRLASSHRPRETARLGFLLGAVLLGVLALDISGVTRGEVERIWLPYAAWMTAGAAIYRAPARRMLLAQVVTALLIEALVKSPW